MNKLKSRKPFVILISFIALCLVGAIFTNRFFNREIIHQQEKKLSREIQLIETVILEQSVSFDKVPTNGLPLEKLVGKNERLTILDDEGLILFDSSHKEKAIGQRDNRPEVRKILVDKASQATSLRESDTVGEKLLYVARPVKQKGKVVGVLRLSETYAGFSAGIKEFQLLLFTFVVVLISIIMILLMYFLRHSNEPIRFVLPVLKEAIAHPEKKQELNTGSEEWNELYQLVNQLMRETNQLYYQQLQSEEKLQFLLENLMIGVFIMNDQLEIVSANPVMTDLFGDISEDKTIFYKEWLINKDLLEMVESVAATNQESQREIHLNAPIDKDLNVMLRILKPENQEVREFVGIVYDLTAIRKLELMHQDFISNISHELKTPTTSIIGFSDTLLDGALEDKTVSKEFVEIIQLEANRLYGLIQNILLLLRTEDSLEEKDQMLQSPMVILDEELERYKEQLGKKSIKLTVSQELLTDLEIQADYFQPIVKNLIENAVEYTEEQGQIHVTLRERGDSLLFSVADTGVGISEKDQQRIFERFYRVSKSRQRNKGGSGLGLSIVSHYVSLLNGSIELVSTLAEGTRIAIMLPLPEKNLA